MSRTLINQTIAASAMLLAALPLQAQTLTSTKLVSDQILPQDTYLYVSMPDVAALKDFVTSSSLGRLWHDPAVADFKEEVRSAIDDDLQDNLLKFQETLGVSLEEVLSIPTGEVSLAVSAGTGNSMGAIFFLDFGDSGDQVQELLNKAVDALSQAPNLSQQEESFDGTSITMFEIDHGGPAPTPLAKEFGWFLKDQRMVLSNRIELLEGVLTNWEGEAANSFMDNEAYSYIMSKCQSRDRSSLTTLYVDPIGMFTKLVQTGSLGQASMGAGMAMGFLPALGLNQMKAMGAVTEAGSGDFEAVSRSVFYAEQPPTGLMRAIQLDHATKTPPSWVKENVTTYIATKWKIDEAFEAVESVVDMFSGAGTTAMQLDRAAQGAPGIHLKHDIVDQLTGDLQLISAPSENEDLPGDQLLISLGVRDTEAASDVLAKIASTTGLEVREFRDVDLYEVTGPAPGQSFSFAVAEGKMLLSMGGSLIEQVLRNDSDLRPLAESPEFLKISQYFPANAVSVQFSRPADTYRSFYDMLKSGKAAENFPGSEDLFSKIDFSTLPPFETIAKYIKPSGGYAVNDEHGTFMEAFQLKD